MADKKYVYFFGDGKAEGRGDMKDLLGGKGANLADMTSIGLPVPPGFTITTEACDFFDKHNGTYPNGMRDEVLTNLKKLEDLMGAKLGDKKNPLLVSVRSGAAQSMPGILSLTLVSHLIHFRLLSTRQVMKDLLGTHTDVLSRCSVTL